MSGLPVEDGPERVDGEQRIAMMGESGGADVPTPAQGRRGGSHVNRPL
jgi:hypothetical protein